MVEKVGRKKFLREFPEALHEGNAAIFVGAGVSMAAGYPSWSGLLEEIGEELGVSSRDILDLAALAQWHIRETGNATGVRNVIKREIGADRDIPETARILSRFPVRHIWTTNYDRIIERSFAEISRPIDVVSGAKDLALKVSPGATRLYKMHGSIERLDDIVISTDDYELYRSKRGAFLPLLQAHLSGMSMLFVGLSLADPNIRHVLLLIRESFTDAPPEHFAILRPPKSSDFKTPAEFEARSAQHRLWAKDLGRYGLVAVEVDDYDEVPGLLHQVERRVAAKRVWISGSWPLDADAADTQKIYSLSEALGRLIGATGRDLVSGAGVMVGPASIAGFMESLRSGGGWDLDRRLIARPFPQPVGQKSDDRSLWLSLRRELARQAGVAIFVGGLKMDGHQPIVADGVMEEFELAKAAGTFLLPIAATGGAAAEISRSLLGSDLPVDGATGRRPTDEELLALADPEVELDKLVTLVRKILDRVSRGGQ